MIGVVTCFFNPCGYKSTIQNFRNFRAHLNYPLTIIELAFDDHFSVPDAIQIQGSEANIMWQKERLLNIGMQSLSANVDKVAWLDADLIFLNDQWLQEAEEILETYPVVQLYDTIEYLDSQERVISSHPSLARIREAKLPKEAMPKHGGGLAARREVIEQGLLDFAVMGGADSLMACAWCGIWDFGLMSRYTPAFIRSFYQWGAPQFKRVAGKIGCVSGKVLHLYHGSRRNRLYVERCRFLKDHDFNPTVDIVHDDTGVWRWATDKPVMHRQVRDYFVDRKEDA